MQILQLSMLGWTQEMIGDLTNLSKQAIEQRFRQEIADLQKLVESKLKLRNPADLTSDPETPTPEILAWALNPKDGKTQEEIGRVVKLSQNRVSQILALSVPDNPSNDLRKKLGPDEEKAVIRLLLKGETQASIAKEFRVSQSEQCEQTLEHEPEDYTNCKRQREVSNLYVFHSLHRWSLLLIMMPMANPRNTLQNAPAFNPPMAATSNETSKAPIRTQIVGHPHFILPAPSVNHHAN